MIRDEPGYEFVAGTRRVVEESSIADSEMIFAGYGVAAPEYGWNDYEGLDALSSKRTCLDFSRSFVIGDNHSGWCNQTLR